jgi:beta-glucosidase
MFRLQLFDPSSPLKAIKAKLPSAALRFSDGAYPAAAAAIAAQADIAIVFATQWMIEGEDVPDLSLPNGQDALIAAVAKANPHTIVVLETGGPVQMPWLDDVGAVVEAWYPGAKGGDAIADVLFGDAEPSGRLPITFPKSEAQLPRPSIPGYGAKDRTVFDVDYTIEGADVGYRWYARKSETPLFPFGFGLGYTRFAYDGLTVEGGATITARFTVRNTGMRPGTDVPQLYLTDAVGKAEQRLLGWERVTLAPGETRLVTIKADPRLLADFDPAAHAWRINKGQYRVVVGPSAVDRAIGGAAAIEAGRLDP